MRTNSAKTVSNAFLRAFLLPNEKRGRDLPAIFAAAQLPFSLYTDSRARIDGEQLMKLVYTLADITHDVSFDYTEEVLRPELFEQVFLKTLSQCLTLGEVITEFHNFYNLFQKNGIFHRRIEGNSVTIGFNLCARSGVDTHPVDLASMIQQYRFFSWLIGKPVTLNHIGFKASRPPYDADYAVILPCTYSFNNSDNFFSFDRKFLAYPVVRSTEDCLDYRNRLPLDLFDYEQQVCSVKERVLRLMRQIVELEARVPVIEFVAAQLSMSVRSLNRKLELEGETFQQLKSKLRKDMAIEMLDKTNKTITTIASSLGYSETAAFSRAFKSWTNTTPQQYRVGKSP